MVLLPYLGSDDSFRVRCKSEACSMLMPCSCLSAQLDTQSWSTSVNGVCIRYWDHAGTCLHASAEGAAAILSTQQATSDAGCSVNWRTTVKEPSAAGEWTRRSPKSSRPKSSRLSSVFPSMRDTCRIIHSRIASGSFGWRATAVGAPTTCRRQRATRQAGIARR